MRSAKFRTAITVLGLVLVAAVGIAQARHGGPGGPGEMGFGGHGFGFFTDYLDLTDAQQTQAKGILDKEKPTLQPLMQQIRQSRHDLMQLEQSGTFDEAKVRDLATKQSSTMTELTVQRARVASELYQLLTVDQKAKLADLMARREQRMQKHANSATPQ
jgi:protein CpxP